MFNRQTDSGIALVFAATFFSALSGCCGFAVTDGGGNGPTGGVQAATEPLHPAKIHHDVPHGIGGGNSRMKSKLLNMNYSGSFEDGRRYRWNWKWIGTRGGKDIVKFTFRIGNEEPFEKEIEYGGGTLQVLDHPDLKVEMLPLTE